MNIPIVGRMIDERFLNRRRQATSLMGIIGGLVATALFSYRFYINHIWSWDLFIVIATIVLVKVSVMTWYVLTD